MLAGRATRDDLLRPGVERRRHAAGGPRRSRAVRRHAGLLRAVLDLRRSSALWEFRTNWTTPTSSTFQNVQNVTVAGFDANMCNYARNCIPQPGTTVKLDAISDRLMYRLQYRNFGTHQTLVTNHTVDVGSDHAGVRWYELRKTTGNWAVQQQGTFAPDAAHRWMGSVAMNGAGDMALGYSVSSSSIYPSIRATGRLATDAAGTMTRVRQRSSTAPAARRIPRRAGATTAR